MVLSLFNIKIPTYEECTRMCSEGLKHVFYNSACMTAIIILLALGFLFFLNKKSKNIERYINKNLLWYFCAVWVLLFIVYDVGTYTGEANSIWGNAPMAFLHAFQAFLLHSDVSAIHEPFHNNWFFMFWFSLAHFLAALVSLIFVIKHFGYNIISSIKMLYHSTKLSSSKEDTYIFWGLNDASFYLAKSIKDHYEKHNLNTYRIVFVRTNDDYEKISARNELDRLFDFISMKNKDVEKLQDINCLTTSTYSDISKMYNIKEDNSDDDNTTEDILLKKLRLASLRRIICNRTTKNLHIFFLNQDQLYNIQSTFNLKKDEYIISFANGDNHKVKFYCNARHNSVHRVLEDNNTNSKIEIKVIDSSFISVELLKQKSELQPVNFVKVEDDATVSSAFNSMVIGFSEFGIEAVRFLYEFGAFVKRGSTEDNVMRSDFHCDIVDKQINDLAGSFLANAPSIYNNISFTIENSDHLLSLLNMDCRSVEFYDLVRNRIETLNYIVICTDDDDINISLAIRIYRYAIRFRKQLNNFCVLVRVHNDDSGNIQRIAFHYNRLWKAEQHGIINKNETLIHQNVVTNNEKIYLPIRIFGLEKDTYTFTNIISGELEKLAAEFKSKYDLSVNEIKQRDGEKIDNLLNWEQEYNDLMQLKGKYQGFSPTYTAISKLRRVRKQNFANSLHIKTKEILAKKALDEKQYQKLAELKLVRKENETVYHNNDGSQPDPQIIKVLNVLAQTEHLRWTASHEILGYIDAGTVNHKDEARLEHGCMKNWQDLIPSKKRYDYNVVDVSLGINK